MIALEVQSPFTSMQGLGASVPLGGRGLVHVWGRNDMATTQALGISWIVVDPDGAAVEEYSDWSGGHGPGQDHEFIGGRFDINKTGRWNIVIVLFMNQDAPIAVDSYDGDLCVVAEEWAGSITKKELQYDSVRGDIPVY